MADADGCNKARAILAAVVDLAGKLDLDVVSSGVERECQIRLLTDLGCTKGQGFLFGHPGPALDWLEDVTYSKVAKAPAA